MVEPKKRARRDRRSAKLADEVLKDAKRGGRPRTHTELMIDAGYSRATAEKSQRRTFTAESFREAMVERGQTPEKIQKVVNDAMTAKVVSVYQGTATETDAPDHKVRLASASLAADILGLKKTVIEQKTLNIHVETKDLREALGI